MAKRSKSREIAKCMFLDGWNPKEISEVLGVSNGQIRQWKMLDEWDKLHDDEANPKELLLIFLSGLREGYAQMDSAVLRVCDVLINRGYDEHGKDSKALYEWILNFINNAKKPEVWAWIKYLWNKGDYGVELERKGFLTNEVMLSLFSNLNH